MNIGTLLEHAANQWPDRCALIDDASGKRYCFRELAEGAFGFARKLLLGFDSRPGDRIALLGDASPHYLFADYGVMCAGRVRVSLDPALSCEELMQQLLDSGARLLLFSPVHRASVQALQSQLDAQGIQAMPLDSLIELAAANAANTSIPVRCAPDDIAALNYTGGTTGVPKAVVHTHGSYSAILQNIVMVRREWTGDLMLNVRPLWPIAAISLLAHLLQGGTVILAAQFEPQAFMQWVARYQPSCTSLVPTHLVRLLRALPEDVSPLSSLACIEVGAAAIPHELLSRAVAALGSVLSTIYGLTEAPWTCYRSPALLAEVLADPAGTHGLVGPMTFGSEVRIGSDQHPQDGAGPGEILIRGAHVMQGYWGHPELNAQALQHGWLHTGDLGSLDNQGRLTIQGRAKSIIRSGGKSVQPAEVEQTLCLHPSILEAAVVGLPDSEWGEIVVAAVVAKPDQAAHPDELQAFCRERLSAHKRPKHILIMDNLPRSHYGKVLSAKIKDAILASRTGSIS